jgi:ketosteroid isomerase-like protein
MERGDTETFFAGYTDDVVIHIGGDHRFTGDYKGIGELQSLYGKFMEAAGEYEFENHAYLADDEHGVIMQRATMKKDGKTFSTDETFVIHFRNGKVSEMWYQPMDTAGVDAWFGK